MTGDVRIQSKTGGTAEISDALVGEVENFLLPYTTEEDCVLEDPGHVPEYLLLHSLESCQEEAWMVPLQAKECDPFD